MGTRKQKTMSDLIVENHGSIFLLLPNSTVGEEWLAENVQAESMLGNAIAVEHRFIRDIVDGAIADGLHVE